MRNSASNAEPHSVVTSTSLRYVLQKIIALDGDFRLVNFDSSISDDPLGPGWCIFVPPSEYKAWLSGNVSETNVRG